MVNYRGREENLLVQLERVGSMLCNKCFHIKVNLILYSFGNGKFSYIYLFTLYYFNPIKAVYIMTSGLFGRRNVLSSESKVKSNRTLATRHLLQRVAKDSEIQILQIIPGIVRPLRHGQCAHSGALLFRLFYCSVEIF